MKTFRHILVFAVVLSLAGVATAANLASDSGSNYTGWASSDNGGTGFGAWTIQSDTSGGGSAGSFLATTGGNGDLSIADASGKAFGTYANGSGFQSVAAFRAFTGGSLSIGQSFLISMDNGGIDGTGGSAGFTLRNGNTTTTADSYNTGSRFEFSFVQGDSDYAIYDASGKFDTGIGWQDTGLSFKFTLTGANTYNLQVIQLGSSITNTFTGRSLGGTLNTGLDSFAMFNRNTDTANVYFNQLAVIPEPSTLVLVGAGLMGLVALRRRRS